MPDAELSVSTRPAFLTAVTRVDSTGLADAAVATGAVDMPVKLPAPDLGTEAQPGPKSAVVVRRSLRPRRRGRHRAPRTTRPRTRPARRGRRGRARAAGGRAQGAGQRPGRWWRAMRFHDCLLRICLTWEVTARCRPGCAPAQVTVTTTESQPVAPLGKTGRAATAGSRPCCRWPGPAACAARGRRPRSTPTAARCRCRRRRPAVAVCQGPLSALTSHPGDAGGRRPGHARPPRPGPPRPGPAAGARRSATRS